MPDLVREVRRRLAEAADPARAPAMQAYMKSALPFYGVSAVPLRRICRGVYDTHPLGSRAEWEAVVRRMWDDATHREERYAAMALTRHRHYRAFQDPDTLPLYRHLVVTGAWWDLVDPVAAHNVGPVLVAFPDAVTPVVRGWATDDDLWVRRTALLCQLGRKTDLDTALLAAAIEANLEGTPYGREFFIRKAIGWALRQYAYTDPGWVRGFVAGHEARLSGLSRREALKHVG
ncbi:MAG: DNA alkylation repair protein [Nocardioidaceae bacterium]